jgi:hypothetical protein
MLREGHTVVYHGCRIEETFNLLDGKSKHFPGLYVTDTFARALRYACARATGVVDEDVTALAEGAAVVELATDEPIRWSRRPNTQSLDKCETTIQNWKVVRIYLRPPKYENVLYNINGTYIRAGEYITRLAETVPVEVAHG